jgi:hypothetical protein
MRPVRAGQCDCALPTERARGVAGAAARAMKAGPKTKESERWLIYGGLLSVV